MSAVLVILLLFAPLLSAAAHLEVSIARDLPKDEEPKEDFLWSSLGLSKGVFGLLLLLCSCGCCCLLCCFCLSLMKGRPQTERPFDDPGTPPGQRTSRRAHESQSSPPDSARPESMEDELERTGGVEARTDQPESTMTAEFRENMGLALRGGIMVTVVGLPFLFSPNNEVLPEFWNELRRQGVVNTFAVVMCIYTLYKSVGETVSFAWQGMAGTVACSTTIWLMFQIFPGGVTPDAPPHYFWCGLAIGLIFLILMLGLNVGLLSQIFGIANFTYFYMSFMRGQSGGFSKNWEFDTTGAAVSTVMVSLIGVTLAIIATLLPWPILLIRKAKAGASTITEDTCELWSRAVWLFCAEGKHEFEKDRLHAHTAALSAGIAALGYNIDNAWWECFGLGPWQRSRQALAVYRSRMMENHDRFPSLLFACKHNDGGQSHFDLINPIKPIMEELVSDSQILYEKATAAAAAGGISSEEEYDSMYDFVKKTETNIESLAKAFQKTKKALGLPMVNSDQMDEHAFCFNLCSNGRIACDLAGDLIAVFKDKEEHSVLPSPGLSLSIFSPSVIFDPAHLSFLMRNSITLIACFVVGWFGFPPFSYNLIKPGSAGVACTGAILLSSFKPSMTKNLDRLQGVVLGSIVGQLVWCALGWCTWWGYLGISVAVFVWVTGTLYMYYNSARYGVVGCLLAAFGTGSFLQGCSEGGGGNPANAYFTIVECVVAIFIVIAVDAVTSTSRCSDMAHAAYLEFWQSIRHSVEGILDAHTHTRKADHAALLAKVQLCAMLNVEATDEPRWWRTPWRKHAYAEGLACATKLRLALKTMEDSIPGQDNESSTKASSKDFDKMLAMPSFDRIRVGVNGKFEQLERFLRVFKHEKEGIMEELRDPSHLPTWSKQMKEGVEEFMMEAIAMNTFNDEECQSLEDDNTCEVSLFLSSVEDMMTAMRAFQKCILLHA